MQQAGALQGHAERTAARLAPSSSFQFESENASGHAGTARAAGPFYIDEQALPVAAGASPAGSCAALHGRRNPGRLRDSAVGAADADGVSGLFSSAAGRIP